MKYYKGFHISNAAKETEIATLTSTKEEPKRVNKIVLTDFETSDGSIITVKIEREEIVHNFRTTGIATAIDHILEIGVDLPVGEALTILAVNINSAATSQVQGYIEYEITR